MFLISSILDKRLEKQCWTLQQFGLLQYWLALTVSSASDANVVMEKGQRKGFVHPFVQDFMIYL